MRRLKKFNDMYWLNRVPLVAAGPETSFRTGTYLPGGNFYEEGRGIRWASRLTAGPSGSIIAGARGHPERLSDRYGYSSDLPVLPADRELFGPPGL